MDLQSQTAVYIIHGQAPRGGMFRLHDIEEVGIGIFVEERKIRRLSPCIYPFEVEIRGGVAFDVGIVRIAVVGRGGVKVEVVFHRGEEGEEVFFELQPDEFFGAHVAHRAGARGVGFIPGFGDGGCEEVDPAAIGGREGEGGAKGAGGYIDGGVVELRGKRLLVEGTLGRMCGTYVDEDVAVAVSLLEEEGVCGAHNIGFCTEVGEGVKLLQWCIGSKKTALILSVSRLSYRDRHQAPTFPNI